MTAHRVRNDNRVLRLVMPVDTALSGIFVVLALVAVPALVLLDASAGVLWLVGLVAMVISLALAAMGGVTAWTLLRSMARGRYELPSRLWLPLPKAAQPFPGGWTDTAGDQRTDTAGDPLPMSLRRRGGDVVHGDVGARRPVNRP